VSIDKSQIIGPKPVVARRCRRDVPSRDVPGIVTARDARAQVGGFSSDQVKAVGESFENAVMTKADEIGHPVAVHVGEQPRVQVFSNCYCKFMRRRNESSNATTASPISGHFSN
jgi:hypothetical protein